MSDLTPMVLDPDGTLKNGLASLKRFDDVLNMRYVRRKLDQKDDMLSLDCGGDCWGCIGEIEADMGDEYSLAKVREEFAKGLRPGWIDLNKKSFNEDKK